jgi:hypothetical protein
MLKTVYAIAVAAIVAACLIAFPSLSVQVEAHASMPAAKSDRLDMRPIGGACSQHEWPYYEAGCLRDSTNAVATVRQVRSVSADRLPQLTIALAR